MFMMSCSKMPPLCCDQPYIFCIDSTVSSKRAWCEFCEFHKANQSQQYPWTMHCDPHFHFLKIIDSFYSTPNNYCNMKSCKLIDIWFSCHYITNLPCNGMTIVLAQIMYIHNNLLIQLVLECDVNM